MDPMNCASETTEEAVKFPVEALLDKGNELLQSGQPQLALQFFKKGLEQEGSSLNLLEAVGVAYMELGEEQQALQAFKRCVEISPDESGHLWMYLGQLQQGAEAVESFKKGVQLLNKDYETTCGASGQESIESLYLRKQLVAAYCSIAELYMTDMCFENDAESTCEKYLQQALQLNQEDPQALQLHASFFISVKKTEEARRCILQALAKIKKDMSDHNDLSQEENFALDLLPYEFRVGTARILIELKEHAQAIDLLESLVEEDDEIVEVWILLAECHSAENGNEVASECLARGKEMVSQFIKADPSNKVFQEQLGRITNLEQRSQSSAS